MQIVIYVSYSSNIRGFDAVLFKIRAGLRGKRCCTLVAHGKEIGGEDREFPYKATRSNGLWWTTEAQMMDIAFRRGFDKDPYDSMYETVSKAYSMEYENLSMDNPPAELTDAAWPMGVSRDR